MNTYTVHIICLIGGILIGYFAATTIDSHPRNDMSMGSDSVEMSMEDGMDMQMNPDPIEVDSSLPIPTIEIVDSFRGMMGEYTFQLAIDNFTIDPVSVDGDPAPNKGHGHVFVNDVRAGRVYGGWVYVPGSYFSPGRNKVTVSLNANNHAFWTVNDSVIEDTIFVEY